MLLNPLLSYDLAQDRLRDRRQRAALDARASALPRPLRTRAEVRSAPSPVLPPTPSAPAFRPLRTARASLAAGLRGLALRLDPSVGCEVGLVRLPNSR
jgi:hypothetical protein